MTELQQVAPSHTKRLPADPFSTVTKEHLEVMINFLRDHPAYLMDITPFRQLIARERYKYALEANTVQKYGDSQENCIANTLDYNFENLAISVSQERPIVPIRALTAIEKVWKNSANLDVLSVGPRSEIELFILLSHGFNWNRIRALDLFGYSEKVDVGDMHCMPYQDKSFDVLIYAWVLSYSKAPQTVADEIMRCARPGAIVALTADYSSDATIDDTFNHENTHVQSTQQILDYFGDQVRTVYFRQDPDRQSTFASHVVFELK